MRGHLQCRDTLAGNEGCPLKTGTTVYMYSSEVKCIIHQFYLATGLISELFTLTSCLTYFILTILLCACI